MNIARLRGNKRRVYEILSLTQEGQEVLKKILQNPKLIVNYGSIKTFIDNKDKLLDLLGVLLDGSLYIMNYLKDIKDHNLNENEYTKVLDDALKARGSITTAVVNFFGLKQIDNDAISKFIDNLDKASDIDTTNNEFTNIVGVSVFKQIYTMMYNFVLECNGITKGSKLKAKGGYTASTNIHGETYEAIMPENIKTGGKKSQLLKWISSRWNWTLPICCFDKIIHCYSEYFNILDDVHNYLPTIKYLSGVLKCSAESFLNCYDVGFVINGVILRTSKQLKNDGTGLYLSARPTNRTYNFHNLRVKGENSEQKSWYKLFINGTLMDMATAEKTYNTNIKASSTMKPFADFNKEKKEMIIEPNKNNQNPQNVQNQNPQNVQNQINPEDYKKFVQGFVASHGGDYSTYTDEYLMSEYLKSLKGN